KRRAFEQQITTPVLQSQRQEITAAGYLGSAVFHHSAPPCARKSPDCIRATRSVAQMQSGIAFNAPSLPAKTARFPTPASSAGTWTPPEVAARGSGLESQREPDRADGWCRTPARPPPPRSGHHGIPGV